MAAFRLTVVDDASVAAAIRRHIGARRYSYNRCLEAVKSGLDAKDRDPDRTVPWTGFDLIKWFNAWKKTDDAGRVIAVSSEGEAELVATGLGWQQEVCAQVFEEAAQDLGRALAAFGASRRGQRGGPKVGFPRFHKMGRGTESFRLRNKVSSTGRHSIRVGDGAARSVTLPVIGVVGVREDSRRLRRLLRPGEDGAQRGRICSVTVAEHRGRFVLTLTCEVADLHPALRHPARAPGGPRGFVGLDRGLAAYVVGARADGNEVVRIGAPRPLQRALRRLRRASRSLARKQPGSTNRKKAADRYHLVHARIADQRRDFTHRTSTRLVKTHDGLCIEDLAVANLVKNRHLARPIADAGWSQLAAALRYKADWYGAVLVVAPRFFPSTKTCSRCGWRWEAMGLSDRTFRCGDCGLVVDRDTNAAANLAAWGDAEHASVSPAPDPDARGRVTNACGGRSAGRHVGDGGTALEPPIPGKKQEPTQAAAPA